jgi:hypothetical protein
MRYAFALAALALVPACSAAAAGDDSDSISSRDVTSEVAIRFAADGTKSTSATLLAGGHARITYDAARLTACRGDLNGGPGWAINGHYRINGGAVSSFEAGGLSPSHGTDAPVIALTAPGDLEMWFENTSAWGCDAYDSDYGKNYHFTIAASASAPGWVGNANAVISRATCGNGLCDSDLRPLAGGFTFDTWTRERAAITEALFEVWKQGTTDFDNADLWKQLDVELHARVGDTGTFATSYVAFDRRIGNNARYAVQLRGLDPLPGSPAGGSLTSAADCPKFATSISADGQYVQADLQFYVTVNGVELRPSAGAVFHGLYQNYRGIYAICEGR